LIELLFDAISLGKIRNRYSSKIDAYDVKSLEDEGRSQSNLAKTRDFFDLDLMNSKSNSCKITIHLVYFPSNN